MLIGTSGRAARIARTTGSDARQLHPSIADFAMAGPGRLTAHVEEVGAFVQPSVAPELQLARHRVAALTPPDSSPSPLNESGVTLTMPITNVRSPQANVRGQCALAAGGRAGMP